MRPFQLIPCILALTSTLIFAAEDPQPGPDSRPKDGVPKGEVLKGEFDDTRIYPGTWREYWVYRPAGYDASKPSPVMVFQDGLQYNAPVVFDNLIARKEIPSLVGVFVMHGRVRSLSTRYTWTQHDPELLDRRELSPCRRSGLMGEKSEATR